MSCPVLASACSWVLFVLVAEVPDILLHHQELIAEETAKRKDDVACVLCVGHNKGMEEAASHLAVCRLTTACPSTQQSLPWTKASTSRQVMI